MVMLLSQYVDFARLSQPINCAVEGKGKQHEVSTSVRNNDELVVAQFVMCLHGFVLPECPSISKICIHVLCHAYCMHALSLTFKLDTFHSPHAHIPGGCCLSLSQLHS